MSPETDNESEDDKPFGYEPEYVEQVIREMLERKRPGIDKTAATLYWNLRELIKVLPGLRDQLEEFSQEPKKQYKAEFDTKGDHWEFIVNKDDRVGDFRLVRGDKEEAMILIRAERDNTFAYWNERFAVPSGAKIFRGPNEPAAKKIQSMITQLARDGLS